MAEMSIEFMQICSLAADKDFDSGQRAWAAEVRRMSDRQTKVDAVSNFLKNFPYDKQQSFLDATMLVLKGDGTPGAAMWMQKMMEGGHVTINDIVDELR